MDDRNDRKLSEKTVENYSVFLDRLNRNYGGDITDFDKVSEYIYGIGKSLSNEKMYFQALHHHFRQSKPELAGRYKEQFTKIGREMTEKSKEQVSTETEKARYMDYPYIQKTATSFLQNEGASLEDKLLVAFYSLMPPVRRDYERLTIYTKKPTDVSGNYIVMGRTPTVYIQEHKTASKHGTMIRRIPAEIIKLLKEWRRLNPDKKLFDKTPQTLSKKLKGIFNDLTGKQITVNIIRHSFVNYHRGNEMPLSQKEELAKLMGHSVGMNELYRRVDI
jgi:hypothetical protein